MYFPLKARVRPRFAPIEPCGTITAIGDGWRVVTWEDNHESTRLSITDAKRLLEAVNG